MFDGDDVRGSRQSTEGVQVHQTIEFSLSLCMCNIPNFLPNTYRKVPIDYDDYVDVLFLYWAEDPTAYEHDDLFYILGISQLLIIYVYACCVGHGP